MVLTWAFAVTCFIVVGLVISIARARSQLNGLRAKLLAADAHLSNYAAIEDVTSEVARLRAEFDVERGRAIEELSAERRAFEASVTDQQRKLDEEIARARAQLETDRTHVADTIERAQRKFEADVAYRRQEAEREQLRLATQLQAARGELASIETQLAQHRLDLDLEEMGFYQPKFDLEDAPQFAHALTLVREAQKELIRRAQVLEAMGSAPTRSMLSIGKLAVDALNGEAATITSKVTSHNFETSRGRLERHFDRINRQLEAVGLRISTKYLELKIKEMALAFDYERAEEKARQEQAELRAMMREEEDARAEAEEAREKALADERRYQQALDEAQRELATKSAEERATYEEQIRSLEEQLREAHARSERAISMAQITRKGHVYIISNVGSFGEGVFKIGVTRRMEPKERIRELGDASVPFPFDIHALVHADDAPALEAALHGLFESRRINRVNLRKEFFRVSIEEIGEACAKLGAEVRLSKLAEARDYRESLQLQQASQDSAPSPTLKTPGS